MAVTKEELESAINWFEHNDIKVRKVDFNKNVEYNLAIETDDSNKYLLELSQEEIAYRAELWDTEDDNL